MSYYDDPLMPSEPEVSDLVGLRIVKAEHVTGESDVDEAVNLTFDNGWTLEIGASEWLHVKIDTTKAMPTTTGA